MESSRGEKRKGKPVEKEDDGRRGDSDHSTKSEKEDDDDCIGPSPSEISKPKKRKGKCRKR